MPRVNDLVAALNLQRACGVPIVNWGCDRDARLPRSRYLPRKLTAEEERLLFLDEKEVRYKGFRLRKLTYDTVELRMSPRFLAMRKPKVVLRELIRVCRLMRGLDREKVTISTGIEPPKVDHRKNYRMLAGILSRYFAEVWDGDYLRGGKNVAPDAVGYSPPF